MVGLQMHFRRGWCGRNCAAMLAGTVAVTLFLILILLMLKGEWVLLPAELRIAENALALSLGLTVALVLDRLRIRNDREKDNDKHD